MRSALRYEADALADLERIIDYGAEQHFGDPVAFVELLIARLELLREHPHAGRVGRVAGTRELVLAGTPFIAVYGVDAAGVTVRRVLNGAQQWPNQP